MEVTKNKAVFIDRDGVLNVDKGYTHKIGDFELKEGVIDGLKILTEDGYLLFIVTNQSGIGNGYYTEDDMHKFHKHMLKIFSGHRIQIKEIYFCPHKSDSGCDCRKPSTKHIKEATDKYNIDLGKSFVIGDKASDVKLGNNAGANSIFIIDKQGPKKIGDALKENPFYVTSNFLNAVYFIAKSAKNKVISQDDLENIVKKLRNSKKKIVTLNGAFDILHKGHEKILREAKKQGNVLFVGLNSDNFIRKSKEKRRPINNIKARLLSLSANPNVDYVFEFSEDTPVNFLEKIKPDIHVNGSEYGEQCIEKDVVLENGGSIWIVELLDGYSTTRLINGE